MKNHLGKLSSPKELHSPVVIDGHSLDSLVKFLELMLTIRKTEQRLALGRKDGLIGGPVHLGAGQEAIAVGVSKHLRKTDRVFGAHRSHSHLLALNPDFYRLFAEVLGKETGFSKGMGGSMHLFDQSSGFYGSVPIVAGTVSLAVGAAMAAKFQGVDDIGVAYIGDGAAEEGVVHESLNLAKIQNAPMLFVIENNLFASHMHISLRQPSDMVARFAKANDISYEVVDGNDVLAVSQSANRLIDDIGVAYIGDGAAEEGVVHESLNLAKIQNAPMLFVIENNLFASHMHISLRQPSDMVARFAQANDIPYEVIDGNDVVAVSQAANRLIDDIRLGKGPRLLELVTYRWYGHVDWRDDVDVGVERSLTDINNWKARDPIVRLSTAMLESDIWCQSQIDELNQRLDDQINKAWDQAMSDPYPSPDATLKYVYSQ